MTDLPDTETVTVRKAGEPREKRGQARFDSTPPRDLSTPVKQDDPEQSPLVPDLVAAVAPALVEKISVEGTPAPVKRRKRAAKKKAAPAEVTVKHVPWGHPSYPKAHADHPAWKVAKALGIEPERIEIEKEPPLWSFLVHHPRPKEKD